MLGSFGGMSIMMANWQLFFSKVYDPSFPMLGDGWWALSGVFLAVQGVTGNNIPHFLAPRSTAPSDFLKSMFLFGWWFGTWMDYLSIQLGISSSHPNWRTHIFQRGRYNYHQPDHDVFRDFWNVSLLEDGTMAFHLVPLTHSSRVVQKWVKPPTCDPLTCGEYRWPLAT